MAVTGEAVINLKADTSQAKADFIGLKGVFDGVAGGLAKFNLALGGLEKAFGLIGKAIDLADFAGEFHQLEIATKLSSATMSAFQGATDGAITKMELMKLASVAMRGDFALTGGQMTTLLGLADELGDEGFGGTQQNFEALIAAVKSGREGELRQLGLDIDLIAGDKIGNLNKVLDAAAERLAHPVAEDYYSKRMHAIAIAWKDDLNSMKVDAGDFFTYVTVKFYDIGNNPIDRWLNHRLKTGVFYSTETAEQLPDYDYTGAGGGVLSPARAIPGESESERAKMVLRKRLGREPKDWEVRDFISTIHAPANKQGRGRPGPSIRSIEELTRTGYDRLGNPTYAGPERFGEETRGLNLPDYLAGGPQIPRFLAERDEGQARAGFEAMQTRKFNEQLNDRTSAIGAGFDAMSQGISASVDAAISGSEGIANAFKKGVAASLRGIAVESSVQALKETAYGFAALAWGPIGGIGAAGHFKAAALFAATAVAAGLGSAALGGTGGGGGGGAGAGAGGGYGTAGAGGGFRGPGQEQRANITNVYVGDGFVGDPQALSEAIEKKLRQGRRSGRSRGNSEETIRFGG